MHESTPRRPFVLSVRDLVVDFPGRHGALTVVDGVSLDLSEGEVLGLVGESGSGKTVTSLAVAGLIGKMGGRVTGGSVLLDGRELIGLRPNEMADVLGREIGMIFQQPIRSLNPTMRVGHQVAEVVRRHEGVSKAEAWDRAVRMLERVHIPDAARRARDYPHMFSGGMSQRVMIAMALVCQPRVLIADEPTTALDVTVQATVLDLFEELRTDYGVSIVLITHDLGVVAKVCDRAAVMYCGQIVEEGPVADVLSQPRHPYTAGLLGAAPSRRTASGFQAVPGTVPPPSALPPGCRFHPRCTHALAGICDGAPPALIPVDGLDRADRCARSHELDLRLTAQPGGPDRRRQPQ